MHNKANEIRGMILDQIYAFGNGHIASSMSIVEILTALYQHGVLAVKPDDPRWANRDRFILSKGHGCSALYAVLADCGFFPKETLYGPQNGSILGGHPDAKKVPGVEIATGSLGHGLAIGIGIALAARKQEKSYHTYVLMGDGELQEGSVWEAALFAAHHNLTNLTVIIDCNGHQSSGATGTIVSLYPLIAKWVAFGWDVYSVDGHDLEQLTSLFLGLRNHAKKPTVVIAHTQKGKGVSFMETDARWHTQIPNFDELVAAKKELGLA